MVVVTKLDRISRNVKDFLELVQELDKHDVKLVSLHENIDLTTPAGKFMTTIFAALAQFEHDMTSARVSEKVLWKFERGVPHGPPPPGYVTDKATKRWRLDPPYSDHIKAMDEIYLERQSTDAVVVQLNRRGYRTKSGARYKKPAVGALLRNVKYAAKLLLKDGRLLDGAWPPLRTWDVHQRIQAILDKNNLRRHGPGRDHADFAFLLQGLLRCGACGHKMSPKTSTGRSKTYPYYACTSAEKSKKLDCASDYLPAEAADRVVLDFLRDLQLKPERLEALARKARESASETLTRLKSDLEQVHARIGSVTTKLQNLANALADASSKPASVLDTIARLESDREELRFTESKLKAEIAAEETEVVKASDVKAALDLFHKLAGGAKSQPERIKALLPRLVDYVVWNWTGKGDGRLEVAIFADPVAVAGEIKGVNPEHSPAPRCAGESEQVDLKGFEPSTS